MNKLSSRLILLAILLPLFVVHLNAHHGSQFLSKAMEMNAAEVQLAEMAIDRTQNLRIKDFARMVVRDQSEALEKIMDVREARTRTHVTTDNQPYRTGVNIHRTAAEVPLIPEHQRTADRLSSLSGDEFDREFINEIAREHRDAIGVFETQSAVHGNGASLSRTSKQQIARQKPAPPDKRTYTPEELIRDVDTADFARETLPILRHHLEEAEEIQKELRKRYLK